ncbi:MAG: 3-phosphoshikimate 1-carboxyvinyltransferase [Phycisphaeraceae bacterium]|nr:3-phosphoshikimate 1-carboxyvinyltransferase [Phycisphaeraceae bacterium]
MRETWTIKPVTGPLTATVRPPGSKSLTNRAMLLAALAQGRSRLGGVLEADDARFMRQALMSLGFAITAGDVPDERVVEGQAGGIPASKATLHVGNAGTAYRFLTAACCLGQGEYELDGVPRMRERPIAQLVQPLRQLGARIEYLGQDGYPPLRVLASGLRGGEVTLTTTLSSQYISALLHIGPYCGNGLTLRFDGPITSEPYVRMTLATMAAFGVEVEAEPGLRRIAIQPGQYVGRDYAIEPDASAASYFLAAAAIVPGSKITIEGLGFRSVQGDAGFAEVLQRMGAAVVCESDRITVIGPRPGERLRGIDVNLNAMPDMAQTLAVVALYAHGRTTIRDVGNLRVKETDRLAALQNELTKLGAKVVIEGDDLVIDPPAAGPSVGEGAIIETYDDHRMAMSFAVASLVTPGVVIADPRCVDKTYPRFFDDLAKLTKDVSA